MKSSCFLARLDGFERLGWITQPTPATSVQSLARQLNKRYIGLKRDDLCPALFGGSKVRKLDYLLAEPRFADAALWHGVGAIGSSNLVALTAAASTLGKKLQAHCFWEPAHADVLDNLAYIASGPTVLRYYGRRLGMGAFHPGVLIGRRHQGAPLVPPGSTCPRSMVGMVRAGLELGAQIEDGELPAPTRIYIPLGTGGTVVGLALGLGLAGVNTTVHAVAVVEAIFANRLRLWWLGQQLKSYLGAVDATLAQCDPVPIKIDSGFLGRGYALLTEAAAEAQACLDDAAGVQIDSVYGSKTAAALLANEIQRSDGNVLFWLTAPRRQLPHSENWQDRLPMALAKTLRSPLPRLTKRHPGRISRRYWLAGATAATAMLSTGAWLRFCSYPQLAGWEGTQLSGWEARVLLRASEVLLPPARDGSYGAIPAAVDAYVSRIGRALATEIHQLLFAVEHATTLVGAAWPRFSALDHATRKEYLDQLGAQQGTRSQMYRGIRDLCLLGYYQQAATWRSIHYAGPWVGKELASRTWPLRYEELVAKAGQLPKSAHGAAQHEGLPGQR